MRCGYLAHHGIKGQEWGVLHGPPYPLNKKISAAVKREAAEEKKIERSKNNYSEILSIAATTAIYAVTGNLVGIMMNGKRVADAAIGKSRSDKMEKERENNTKIDPKTGFKLKDKDYTPDEDLRRINPYYNNFNGNTKNNCMLCTTTYEMRRRGYDVTANKASVGYNDAEIKKWFPKAKIQHVPEIEGRGKFKSGLLLGNDKEYARRVMDAIEKQPEGARGNLMGYINSPGAMIYNCGHSMIWEIDGGKMVIRDGQSNTVYRNPEKVLKMLTGVRYTRTDNVDFDPQAIKECCQ